MPRVPIVVCLIVSVLTAGCASAPRSAAGLGDTPCAPAELAGAAGRPSMELLTGGPGTRQVQPDWWDDHPIARKAAWVGGAVGVFVIAAVVVGAMGRAEFLKNSH